MKNLFVVVAILIGGVVNAQEMNKWSIGVNIGAHDGAAPTSDYTKLYQINHFGLNGRYMVNNRFGLQLDLGYDYFSFKGTEDRNTKYFRTSIEGVINAGDILKFSSFCDRLGFLIHGGAGISNMWINKEFRLTEDPTDPLFKGVDDMVNYIFGATPQFKINERIALHADLSFIFHHNQSMNFDYVDKNTKGAIDGYFLNLSVGASFYLGKHEKHADWTPTVYGGNGDNEAYEARMLTIEEAAIEARKDDDADGVPNYRDEELDTPAGSYVNSKGQALKDRDHDGIADEFDLCPDVKGLYSFNGCMDSDGDGLGDADDACPTVPGTKENRGCPEISKEVKEVLHKALKGVQFETNKDVLLVSSFPSLDAVIKVMNDHPEYNLQIDGHTDDIGTDEFNLDLSMQRAMSVANYLTIKGVETERLHLNGYGETRHKALNDTEAGRALNRRVEFNIVY